VPLPSARRRDRLLALLEAVEAPMTASEIVKVMRAAGLLDYQDDLCGKDLRQLERYRLARSAGHPKRWEASPATATEK
jgi:hypothetical protein